MKHTGQTGQNPTAIEIGGFTLDLQAHQLRLHGAIVPLRRTARLVLLHLAREAGRVVSIDELFDSAWNGAAVTPNALTQKIREIRKALAKDAQASVRIDSEYGIGFRLVIAGDELRASQGRALEDDPEPFIGFASELESLVQRWLAAEQGRSGVALVAGEAGGGKTTLADRFASWISRRSPALVARGRCLDFEGEREPYHPLFEVLDAIEAAIGPASLAAVLRAQAPTWLVQCPRLLADGEAQVLHLQLAGSHPKRMLREAVAMLQAIAEQTPLLLLIEDLHWADGETLSLIRAIADSPKPSRLLVLGTYRSIEAVLGTSDILTLRRRLTRTGRHLVIDLDPWDRSAIAAYAESRLRAPIDPDVARVLEQQSRGNPLFVKAILDTIIPPTPVPLGGDAFELTVAALEKSHLPEHIQSLLIAQLDLLDEGDRNLLAAGALLGGRFSVAAVARAMDTGDLDAQERLERLDRTGAFVHRMALTANVDGYEFLHASYRSAALAGMSPERQRETAARVATLGTEAGPHASPAEIASIFASADCWEAAASRWEEAASQAYQRFTFEPAVVFVRRAIEALERLPRTREGDLRIAHRYIDLANILSARGGLGDAVVRDAFARCEQLAAAAGDEVLAFRARAGQCNAAIFARDVAAAQQHANSLSALVQTHPEFRSMAHLYRSRPLEALYGRFAESLAEVDLGIAALDAATRDYPVIERIDVGLHAARSQMLGLTRSDDAWIAAIEDLMRLPATSRFQAMVVPLFFARTALRRREPDRAYSFAERSKLVAEELGNEEMSRFSAALLASARCQAGTGSTAVLEAVISQRTEANGVWDDDFFNLQVASARIGEGRYDAAATVLSAAFAVPTRRYAADRWLVLGDLLAVYPKARVVTDPTSGAMEIDSSDGCYEQAIAVAREQGALVIEEQAAAGLARLGSKPKARRSRRMRES